MNSVGSLVTPAASSSLTDPFYSANQFARTSNYLLTQWLDVQDALFMGWFMRSSLNDKTILVGGADGLAAGNYTVVVYNNFQTGNGKKLYVRSVNGLGTDNLVLGFSLLGTGNNLLRVALAMFLAMVCLCFNRKRSKNV